MRKLRNKKGFTLIEIIVVLVILAILAAAAIPSMLGFISDARGKALIAEARAGYIAAQAVYTELKMSGSESADIISASKFTGTAAAKFKDMLLPDIDDQHFTLTNDNKGIAKVIYTKDEYTITLERGKAAIVTKSTP